MGTLLDLASLVMIPSGYKDDKLYSVKPTDGSGDFTFSRDGAGASPATRVNASGLIEKGYTNNVLQSNTFSSGTWAKQQSGGTTPVVTSGFADPEGGSNAWRLECSITGGLYSMISQSLSTTGLNCNSIWIKSNTGSDQDVYMRINNADQTTTRTATSTWQRVEVFTDAVGQSFTIGVRSAATGATSSCDVLIYAAQSNEGLVGLPIVETTTAPVSAGLLGDMPRLDYSGGATCPSLLLEPSRVNIIPQSEYFGGYTLVNITADANNATSPEGVQNAYKIIEDSANTNKHFRAANTTLAASTYAVSAFIKPNNCDVISFREGAVSGDAFTYKFSTGTSSIQGTRWNGATIQAEDYGNGWYRVSANFTATSAVSHNFRIHLLGNDFNQTTNPSVGTYTYTGDGASGIWVYGFMAELGSYPTSYIPTYGSASTRGVDSCSKTGISSLIGQTEGTLFLEVKFSKHISELSDGTSTNRIVFYTDDSGYVRNLIRASSVTTSNIQTNTTIQAGDKIALAYSNNDSVIYKNGVQIGSDTSVTVPATSKVNIGSDYAGNASETNTLNQAVLFPTRLTNAELAALTTL